MPSASESADHSTTPPAPEEAGSQVVKAQLKLREMILAGQLAAGRRIAELMLVEQLGVSRTPIRAALMRLEQEGLLQTLPNGGYAVRTFSERDVADAIELRGTVEGLAARMAAERGAPVALLSEARTGLEQIDRVLARTVLDDEAFSAYVELNRAFHRQLGQLSGSAVMQRELERIASMAFASPSAFVLVQADSPRARDLLVVAQDQHWQVLDAIERRESGRADAIMREHSRLACRNLREAMHRPDTPAMPAVRLIRRRD